MMDNPIAAKRNISGAPNLMAKYAIGHIASNKKM
jgi:hypothetical protein